MSTIVTRSGKGVPLTATDHYNNVNNLNTDKVESLSDLGITATATELNYVDGVTSDIQTQIDGKQATIADDGLSGDKIDGGTISNFTSTGIDDNATSTAITIDASKNVGIGVVPESDWWSGYTVLQLGKEASILSNTAAGPGNSFRLDINTSALIASVHI